MTVTDIAIIGAGPYGMAAAARLTAAGASVRQFGEPMSFWQQHMPKGMWLRSVWSASSIGGPHSALSLDEYERRLGSPIRRPIPLPTFIAYAHAFRDQARLDIDPRHITKVSATPGGFSVMTADGESFDCRRVVVATGIQAFASRPREFDGLPPDLASHSADDDDLSRFAGKRVAVIGGGQSAFESAVLLSEQGATTELIMRAPTVRWVGRATRKGLVGHLLFHRTDVGPALMSHLVARPRILRTLPRRAQDYIARRSIAPGASLWLRPRSKDVTITTGRRVMEATRLNSHLRLRLDDGATRDIDHAVLATGFRIDVRRYTFLSLDLLRAVRTVGGCPVLGEGLESSVPGLHFLGAPAMYSFGPVLRFVSGSEFASDALARVVIGERASETRHVRALATSAKRSAP